MELYDVLSQYLITDADDDAQQFFLLWQLAEQNYLDDQTGLLNRHALLEMYTAICAESGDDNMTVGVGILRGFRGERIHLAIAFLRDYLDFEVLYRLGESIVVVWPGVDYNAFRIIGAAVDKALYNRRDIGTLLLWMWDNTSIKNLRDLGGKVWIQGEKN